MVLHLPEADAGQPLTLAVGLKYASDCVTITDARPVPLGRGGAPV